MCSFIALSEIEVEEDQELRQSLSLPTADAFARLFLDLVERHATA
jgi:hypothetical protein